MWSFVCKKYRCAFGESNVDCNSRQSQTIPPLVMHLVNKNLLKERCNTCIRSLGWVDGQGKKMFVLIFSHGFKGLSTLLCVIL